MVNRDTNSDKWKDAWFLDLSAKAKLLFYFFIDNCDIAGFYERHDRIISFLTNIDITSLEGAYKELEKSIILKSDMFWIKNFIQHQGNNPLNPKNPCHIGIIRRLIKNSGYFKDLYKEILNITLEELRCYEAPLKELSSSTGKGKGKGNSNGNSNGNNNKQQLQLQNNNIIKIKYNDYVNMKENEYNKLKEEFGENDTKRMIEILNNYKGSKGKIYKNDYLAIKSWVVDKLKEEKYGKIKGNDQPKPKPGKYDNL